MLIYARRGGTVTPTPTFTVSANDNTVSIEQGGTVTITYTITRLYGFSETIVPTATGLPTGVTVQSWSDSSLSGGDTTTVLTLTAAGDAGEVTNDTFTATFTATSVTQTDNGTVTVTEAAGGDGPWFEDNFDNGSRNNAAGLTWGSGTEVTVSTAESYSGSHALRFFYGGTASGFDSWAEQRFDQGRFTPRFAIEYRLHVPSNFAHRNDGGPTNNKFMSLWGETYEGTDEGRFKMTISFARSGSTSRLQVHASSSSSTTMAEISESEDFVIPLIGGSGGCTIGDWSLVRIDIKCASNRSTNDGHVKIWINGTQILNATGKAFGNSSDTHSPAGIRNAYLLGWANSGYDADTVFFIDDVKLYDTDPGW